MLISRSFLSKVKGTFPFVIFGNVAHFTTIVLVTVKVASVSTYLETQGFAD